MEIEQSEGELRKLFGDTDLARRAKAGVMKPDDELIQAAKAKRTVAADGAATLPLDEEFFESTKKLKPHQVKAKRRNRARNRIAKETRRAQRRK